MQYDIQAHIQRGFIMDLIERPIYMSELEALRDDRDHIKILTGVRKCGKTTLLQQFMDRLRSDGVSEKEMLLLNLESYELDKIRDHTDLSAYLRELIPAKGRFYLFLDEVQGVEGWEKSVNSLMTDTEADIYIASSDAHLFSTGVATDLTGRYVEVKMLPLSFKEYSELKGNGRKAEEVFAEYVETGGIAYIDPTLEKIDLWKRLGDVC